MPEGCRAVGAAYHCTEEDALGTFVFLTRLTQARESALGSGTLQNAARQPLGDGTPKGTSRLERCVTPPVCGSLAPPNVGVGGDHGVVGVPKWVYASPELRSPKHLRY
ncbi:MAG: hypothetical protein WBZ19_25870 [Chthoniobacterales bacterium]